VERAVERDEGDDSVQQGLTDVSIKLGLALRHEFAEKYVPLLWTCRCTYVSSSPHDIRMSRTEVEEMHQIVMAELDHIQKGCVSTIVGG
jgi:hypothetical protein